MTKPKTSVSDVTAAALAGKLLEITPIWLHAMSAPLRHGSGEIDASTLTQMRTLHALHQGPLTFKQLISWRKVAAPTLSRTLDAMVKRGWVDRIPHPDDKRQVLLKLTEAGQVESERLRIHMHEHATELVSKLNGDERHCLFTGLNALLRELQTIDCQTSLSPATSTSNLVDNSNSNKKNQKKEISNT